MGGRGGRAGFDCEGVGLGKGGAGLGSVKVGKSYRGTCVNGC